VDGTITGPFYPLCPLRCVKILDTGIKKFSEAGYIRQVNAAGFVDTDRRATGTYAVKGKMERERYLGIVEQGWKLSGTVSLGPRLVSDLLFIKPAGSGGFVAATELRETADRGDAGRSYQWHMFVSPFILPDPGTPLEMWVYNQPANEFVKIHRERWEKAENSTKSGG
jgi:hypothetical protein